MARRDVRAAVREESNAVRVACVGAANLGTAVLRRLRIYLRSTRGLRATSGGDDERGKTRLRNGIDTRACLYD